MIVTRFFVVDEMRRSHRVDVGEESVVRVLEVAQRDEPHVEKVLETRNGVPFGFGYAVPDASEVFHERLF